MRDYTLAQQYALVGLNGLESIHMDMAKSAVIRAIAMADLWNVFYRKMRRRNNCRGMNRY